MVPRSGNLGVICALSSFAIAPRISHRIPENPCKSVLILTSMAALVVATGSVLPAFTTPAFRNLKINNRLTTLIIYFNEM